MKNIKEIPHYLFGSGGLSRLSSFLTERRDRRAPGMQAGAVILVDEYFERHPQCLATAQLDASDHLRYISTAEEPTTDGIDRLMTELRAAGVTQPCAVVGIGGGITLDTAKAVANLFTNPGAAADYQGWDLVKNPGVFKIGIPTISGTGAESSRTCVMTNSRTGLKLGMNSDHTLFDQLILDPVLTATVDRNQYFFTGMDTYIHGIESLAGSYRNAIGDTLSETSIALCRKVFLGGDMMSDENREQLMVASFLGGRAIATGFVGVVHPMSAALSVVLGTHHCVANCITMTAMDEFYPGQCREFREMVAAQGVTIPRGLGAGLSDDHYARMFAAASLHEKPLTNALGPGFREILTPERMTGLFRQM